MEKSPKYLFKLKKEMFGENILKDTIYIIKKDTHTQLQLIYI